ncbi:ABC transporter permease [Shinella sumterensis]|nr:ABC transporter permease [Shinella sumterensis]
MEGADLGTTKKKTSQSKASLSELASRIPIPLLGVCAMVVLWATYVWQSGVPPYILPGPDKVIATLISDWPALGPALWVTTKTTLLALLFAVIGGGGIALLLAQARWIEALFYPVTVTLQVTPIVAIAPLILIYVPTPEIAQLICAFVVAFFPIMLSTLQGLKSAERHHADLLRTYVASRWQTIRYLSAPTALPHFFAGLKIGGGLALVGAVVGEFSVGQAGANAGLAFRLLEAQSKLNTPRVFAALVLLSAFGAVIFAIISRLSELALRHWHESEITSKR